MRCDGTVQRPGLSRTSASLVISNAFFCHENKAELVEQLAQYILRNPFSVEETMMESPADTVIYRSLLNPKINRNFEVFTPNDFLTAITQHIPDKGAQMVRYYGWYSKMRGQRQGAQNCGAPSAPLRTASRPHPRNCRRKSGATSSSKSGTPDPLICPKSQHRMRVIAVIDQRAVVKKILRHLGLWSVTPLLAPARAPPDANAGPWHNEPCDDVHPMPD
jgi:hypothetical protein